MADQRIANDGPAGDPEVSSIQRSAAPLEESKAPPRKTVLLTVAKPASSRIFRATQREGVNELQLIAESVRSRREFLYFCGSGPELACSLHNVLGDVPARDE